MKTASGGGAALAYRTLMIANTEYPASVAGSANWPESKIIASDPIIPVARPVIDNRESILMVNRRR